MTDSGQALIDDMRETVAQLARTQEVKQAVSEELEEVREEARELAGTSPAELERSSVVAMKDATTVMSRLDNAARRAERLARGAEKMALTIAHHEARKGEGPAYMNAAVRALREEMRCYETAMRLTQMLTEMKPYAINTIREARKESWVAPEGELETGE